MWSQQDGPLAAGSARPLAEATLRRLTMYRLRADVQFAATDLAVTRGLERCPRKALCPTHATRLGLADLWGGGRRRCRWIGMPSAWRMCIPETGIELIPDDSYILECGFERLHGVDFRKGCYVGQEVTARMKHKTELRKGLAKVSLTAGCLWARLSRLMAKTWGRCSRNRAGWHCLSAV